MISALCPDCGERIALGSLSAQGSQLLCPSCGAHLQVIGLDPMELDWVYVYPVSGWEEDWDRAAMMQHQSGVDLKPSS